MLIIQIIILILVSVSFPLINQAAAYISARSGLLTAGIADPKYLEASRIAEELSHMREVATAAAYLSDLLSPQPLSGEWLALVNSTVPDGVTLESFEITGGGLTISCQTAELTLIEEHRLALAEEGFTPTLGSVASLNGTYGYTLSASV